MEISERSWMIYETYPVPEGRMIEVVPKAKLRQVQDALLECVKDRDHAQQQLRGAVEASVGRRLSRLYDLIERMRATAHDDERSLLAREALALVVELDTPPTRGAVEARELVEATRGLLHALRWGDADQLRVAQMEAHEAVRAADHPEGAVSDEDARKIASLEREVAEAQRSLVEAMKERNAARAERDAARREVVSPSDMLAEAARLIVAAGQYREAEGVGLSFSYEGLADQVRKAEESHREAMAWRAKLEAAGD